MIGGASGVEFAADHFTIVLLFCMFACVFDNGWCPLTNLAGRVEHAH
jgi:hypothetical protein